jgi:hypothetical protein
VIIPRRVLEQIAAGTVTLAFRRWRRPTVRAGGTLRTAVGVLAIDAVDPVDESDISPDEARRAGFRSRDALLAELARRPEGRLYRIALRLSGPDPRVALRERADLDDAEAAEVERRLARLDAAGRRGPWTVDLLRMIDARPAVRAADLAASAGLERDPFKADVRKLKELGLTESLDVGYRLSPRGAAVLARLSESPRTGSGSG